jgi:ribonuclease J
MMAYEYGNDIIVVDAGIMFPKNDMLGVDYIIPDYEYLKKRANRVVGLFITHGHEDHIGAIQHLLKIFMPVYATPLTRGLIEAKLHRNNAQHKVQMKTIQAGESTRSVRSG